MNRRSAQRYEYQVRQMPAGAFQIKPTGERLQKELDDAAVAGWRLASTLPVGHNGNPILIILERPLGGDDAWSGD